MSKFLLIQNVLLIGPVGPALEPKTMLLLPDVKRSPEAVPRKVLAFPVVLFNPDRLPIKVFPVPVVFNEPESFPTNTQSLELELGDVIYAMGLLDEAGDITYAEMEKRVNVKRNKHNFLHHQGSK